MRPLSSGLVQQLLGFGGQDHNIPPYERHVLVAPLQSADHKHFGLNTVNTPPSLSLFLSCLLLSSHLHILLFSFIGRGR